MVRLNPQSIRVLNQDGAADAIHSVEGDDHVGAFLREARENTGRSVADVAQTLRIRRVYLEAIEDGRFDELPGAAYAVGFIRSYATYLRLDVATLVARFKEEASGIEAKQDLDFPTPVPEGRFPGGVVVALCLMLTAAGAGGWYWWQNQNAIEIARVPPPPEAVTGASDTPVAGAADVPVSTDTSISDRSVVTAPVVPENGTVDSEVESDIPVESVTSGPDVPSAEGPLDAPVPDNVTSASVASAETLPSEDASPLASSSEATQMSADGAAADAPDSSDDLRETIQPALEPESDPVTETVADSTARKAAPSTVPSEVTAVAEPEVATAPNSDLNVGVALPSEQDNPPPSEAATGDQTSALPSIPGAPAVSGADSEGRTYGTVNRGARIVLSATDPDTWVQVMDSQQNALLTQMLRPGDRYLVPDRPGLSLQTNNAGGLDIRVDGETVPTIGGRGEIRREVRLDPELLKSGAAVIQ
jgi:cytoskeleton protein RodZ